MKRPIFTACALALLTSCQSLRPLHSFPDDDNSSTRWLEIGRGECYASSRTVVTDKECVSEYSVRINEGRNRGRHALKEQKRAVLSPSNARAFWRYVDSINIWSWSDADMPLTTDYPSLTYRKNSTKVEFHSLLGRSSGEPTFNDRRFEALDEKIDELQKLSTAPTEK